MKIIHRIAWTNLGRKLYIVHAHATMVSCLINIGHIDAENLFDFV